MAWREDITDDTRPILLEIFGLRCPLDECHTIHGVSIYLNGSWLTAETRFCILLFAQICHNIKMEKRLKLMLQNLENKKFKFFRLHCLHAVHKIRPVATYVTRSVVCGCVCLCIVHVDVLCKMAELNKSR